MAIGHTLGQGQFVIELVEQGSIEFGLFALPARGMLLSWDDIGDG